jgi:secondary thiamine-phosphate synthase enzyme
MDMQVFQKTHQLKPFRRGFHLITETVEAAMAEYAHVQTGMANIFIHHTSASLTINENADSTVRGDFERHFNVMVPEDAPYYQHTYEGSDDMPAHIKASLLSSSLNIPIIHGRLGLGTWQGIYLCEHRDNGGSRKITITITGI